jgi:hypothetical protein
VIKIERTDQWVTFETPDGFYLQKPDRKVSDGFQVAVVGPMPFTPREIADEVELLVGVQLRVDGIGAMSAANPAKQEILCDRGFWRIILGRVRGR